MISNKAWFLVLITLFSVLFSGTVFGALQNFYFTGNVALPNGTMASGVNVSLQVPGWMTQGNANFNGSWSNLTNKSGYFWVNLTYDNSLQLNLRLQIKGNLSLIANDYNYTYIGPALPDFPMMMYQYNLVNQTFYMQKAGNVRITVMNLTGQYTGFGNLTNFSYLIRDASLGTEVASSMTFPPVLNITILTLPLNRNYSITVMTQNSPPLTYTLNNFTLYNVTTGPNNESVPHFLDLRLNTSVVNQYFDGYIINSSLDYVTTTGAVVNATKYEIWMGMLESGNFVCGQDQCMNNVSMFQAPDQWKELGGGVIVNSTSGYYNISFPGTTTGFSAVMFVLVNDSKGNWSLGVQNVTAAIGAVAQYRQNITLRPIVGNKVNNYIAGTNFKSPQSVVQLRSPTGAALASSGFVELQLNYGLGFVMRLGIPTNSSGAAVFPLIAGYGIQQANAFVSQYPPRDTKFSAAQVASGSLSITLHNMSMQSPGGEALNMNIAMLASNTTCDVMEPPAGCYVGTGGSSGQGSGDFNPLSAILRGAVSLRMYFGNGMIMHYQNVDMLSSGPPDFIANPNATSGRRSTSGSLADIWKFGSRGPKIYDSVLIGLNYSANPFDANVNPIIAFNNLYDSDSNLIWNTSDTYNGTVYSAIVGNYSDYATFNNTWFTGMTCNNTGTLGSNTCFFNKTTTYLWLNFPHFSNVGSLMTGITAAGVNLNSSSSVYCNQTCDVYFNVTNYNFTMSLSLLNTSIRTALSSSSNITNINISYKWNTSSSFIWNGTNASYWVGYNFTYYDSNNASNTTHWYWLNITKTNNVTTNLTINYTITAGDGSLYPMYLNVTLTCAESWIYSDWTVCSASTQTRTAVDPNACGTTINRASLSQSCQSTNAGSSGGGSTTPSTPLVTATWVAPTMSAGQSYSFAVANDGIVIDKISLIPTETVIGARIVVRQLSEAKPSSVLREPVGSVYKYLEIAKENLLNSQIQSATLTFNADKAWVDSKGKKENVVLVRYNNDLWTTLTTNYIGESNGKYQFTANSPGFSYFAVALQTPAQKIVQKQQEAAKGADLTAGTPAETGAPENKAEGSGATAAKSSWKTIVIALLIVLVVVIIFYFVYKKRKNSGGIGTYQYKPRH